MEVELRPRCACCVLVVDVDVDISGDGFGVWFSWCMNTRSLPAVMEGMYAPPPLPSPPTFSPANPPKRILRCSVFMPLFVRVYFDRSRRGVLLFVDEADAFLRRRSTEVSSHSSETLPPYCQLVPPRDVPELSIKLNLSNSTKPRTRP